MTRPLPFAISLEAVSPERRHFRAYEVSAAVDLFGTWCIDVRFGPIGQRGRLLRHAASDRAEARQTVQTVLRRRLGAPRRIGVPYRIVELIGDPAWIEGLAFERR